MALFVIPRTSILGAILLTGYLGGATTQVRLEDPWFFFPVVIGVLVWGALVLRDQRLRAFLPLRSFPTGHVPSSLTHPRPRVRGARQSDFAT